jgi:hypothetical protein
VELHALELVPTQIHSFAQRFASQDVSVTKDWLETLKESALNQVNVQKVRGFLKVCL